ncbi:MAG: ribosome assembly cofactor RimP [Flavobacteriaceae bacterium]|nr:ribosome assembly cofactor RimP [Flavobacteriaceae bacterium]
MNKDKITQLVNEALAENVSLFLIDLDISDTNKISVVIDGDSGVPLSECIRVSRHIENNVDREIEDYDLEVASFDIGESLVNHRQYKKNIGRTMKIITAEQKYEGLLQGADDEKISLVLTLREPKAVGKGKVTVEKEILIPVKEIKEAKVKIVI